MSKYKIGDRVRVINGIEKLQYAMRGIGTVAAVHEIDGVQHCRVLIDGFDNPHKVDPTITFHYNQLAPWLHDSKDAKEIALSRIDNYLKYKNNEYKKEVAKKTIIPKIKDVIYNYPATIVFWEDGTKTVVKCKNEKFDPEKGLAMAFSKKMLGNKGNYYEVFKKWLPKEEKSESADIIYVKVPGNHIVIDFDIKDTELSKSGNGIHLHYEEPKRNPVEEAYKKLVDHRDNNGEINFDELIGLLGEALDD